MQLAAGDALGPGIAAHGELRLPEPLEQYLAPRVIVHDRGADLVEAVLLDPFPHALEVGGLLAIELEEGGDVFDRLLLGRDMAEQVGARTCRPAAPAMWMS